MMELYGINSGSENSAGLLRLSFQTVAFRGFGFSLKGSKLSVGSSAQTIPAGVTASTTNENNIRLKHTEIVMKIDLSFYTQIRKIIQLIILYCEG